MGQSRMRYSLVRLLAACFLIGSVALPAASFSAGAASPSGQTITGTFTTIHGDPPPGGSGTARDLYFVTDATGARTQLSISDAILQAAGGIRAVNHAPVSVLVDGAHAPIAPNGAAPVKVANALKPAGGARSASAPADLTGNLSFINLLCAFPDDATRPVTQSYIQDTLTFGAGRGVAAYWAEDSQAHITLNGSATLDWVNLPSPRSTYITGGAANLTLLAHDCTATAAGSVNFNNYYGINMFFNGLLDCCSWGGSVTLTLSGTTKAWPATWMAPPGYFPNGDPVHNGETVLVQEMGQAFGLSRSAGPTGTVGADGWDAMGDALWHCDRVPDPVVGCLGRDTTAFNKDSLGWLPAWSKLTITGGRQTVTLTSLVGFPVGGGAYSEIIIPYTGSTTHFTTVEMRNMAGNDAKNPANAVIIHDVDTTRANPAWVMSTGSDGYDAAEWLAGSEYAAPNSNGITVHVNSIGTDSASITVGNSVPPPTPTGLHVTGATTNAISWGWTPPDATWNIVVSDGTTTTNLAPSTASFTKSGVAPGGYACLSVASWNGGGASAWSGWVCGLTVPLTPTGTHVTSATTSSVSFAWSDPDNLSAIAAVSGTIGGTTPHALAPGTTTYTQTGVAPGYWACVEVAAYNSSYASAFSPWVCGLAVPNAPTAIHVTGHTSTSVSFGWTDSDPYSGIVVSNGTSTSNQAAGTVAYMQGGMTPGSYACISLAAYNSSGASPWSAALTGWVCGQAT